MDVSVLLAPITNAAFLIVKIAGAIFVLVGLLVAINYPKKLALARHNSEIQSKREDIEMRISEARARLLEIQVLKEEKKEHKEETNNSDGCQDTESHDYHDYEEESVLNDLEYLESMQDFSDESDDFRC